MATRRLLTREEREDASEIFHDSIDYDSVVISRGSPLAFASATTIGNTINLRAEHFAGNTLELSRTGCVVLIHELGHVWQFQNGGFAYIRSSLFAQIAALITTGSRRPAYDWRKASNLSRAWRDWNAEEQAQCISDYYLAFGDTDHDHTARMALPYIMCVRRRSGAPGRSKS
jgi:hypothetical protein